MAHSSPELRQSGAANGGAELYRWGLLAAAMGLGVGMGMAATGVTAPGVAVAGASAALCIASVLAGRGAHGSRAKDAADPCAGPEYVDEESGLPNARQVHELLKREIARGLRYGDRTAVALYDVRPAAYQERDGQESRPSPARYVAACLLESARKSDIVARLDETHFVVVLTESDVEGAETFTERTRTKLGTTPFARAADATGLYVRAWAGAARWEASITTPAQYLQAANAALESTRPGYESEQSWYRGGWGD